jgi:hypothetical protein
MYCFYIYSHAYTSFGPQFPPSPASKQNLFSLLILWFCWRENIAMIWKTLLLLVWDKKYLYREIPSVASMHMCITTHINSFLPDLFTSSWSPWHNGLCQFKIIILAPLQWAHQPHSSFRLPSLSVFLSGCLLLVCDPCPKILLHLFQLYNPHMRETIWFLALHVWLTSLMLIFSSSIHSLKNDKVTFFFVSE